MLVRGKVVRGVQEGRKYTSMPVYNILLTELLGETPFPGTLNIETDLTYLELSDLCPPSQIRSIYMEGREYGGFYYWMGYLIPPEGSSGERVRVLVLRPFLTVHGERVLELVASKGLRELFRLNDGDVVSVDLVCGGLLEV